MLCLKLGEFLLSEVRVIRQFSWIQLFISKTNSTMKNQLKIRKIILTETQVKKLIDTVMKQSIIEQSEQSKGNRLISFN